MRVSFWAVNPPFPSVFLICGCLEPGRDGVGDYTRRLAAELAGMGVRCGLASWLDPYVHDPLMEHTDQDQPVLRLPASGAGRPLLRKAVERAGATVLSLQFVPFSFDPRGVVSGLDRELRGALPDLPWQVMVHEPWSDGGRGGALRRMAVTWVQRRATLTLLKRLRPVAVHTSNARYAALLSRGGVRARTLPLFGNIPPTAAPDPDAFDRLLAAAGAEDPPPGPRPFTVGVFGTLHPEWDPAPAAADLANAAAHKRRPLRLVSVGNMGVRGRPAWDRLQRALGTAGLELGARSEGEVSSVLVNLDLGLSSTPWELLGKSGSVAALLEHGVPVVATRGDGRREAERPGVHYFDGAWGEHWFGITAPAARPARGSRLPAVARAFLESFGGSTPASR